MATAEGVTKPTMEYLAGRMLESSTTSVMEPDRKAIGTKILFDCAGSRPTMASTTARCFLAMSMSASAPAAA
jgi:hypothetical protein